MECKYSVFYGNEWKFPAISVNTDKKAQDTVNFEKKLQKSTCNMRAVAIIYNKINLYKFLKGIQRRILKMEGVMSC